MAATANYRTSRYCQAAPMAEYHDFFLETERSGMYSELTRAMTAVILSRITGEEEYYSGSSFPDVDANAWYASGAGWAVENGVMPLIDGAFLPDITISREDLCAVLAACTAAEGITLPPVNEERTFWDNGTINAARRADVTLMQRAGVMIEGLDGAFYPKLTISVSEAEEIFLRFIASAQRDTFPTLPVSTMEESEPVDNAWFDDACFIGHSQVVGVAQYSDLGASKMDFYAVYGHKAQEVLDFRYYKGPTGRYGSLQQALEGKAYGKVYIMLGINDCTDRKNRVDEFMEPMRQILRMVKETQPDAKIYLLSLAPVGRVTRNNLWYNLDNNILYSQLIKQLSREFDTEYIDVFRPLCDSGGYLLDANNAGDGIHLKKYSVLADILRCNT